MPKRRAIQDDTWIEQLATKRAKIGAAKTIAVSERGFSASARKTAALHGIELRRLHDRIEDEVVRQFLSGLRVSLIETGYVPRALSFTLANGETLSREHVGSALERAFLGDPRTSVIASHVASGRGLTIDDIAGRFDDMELPPDGSVIQKVARVRFPPDSVTIVTARGVEFVTSLELVLDFTKRQVPAPFTNLYEYATPERALSHLAEARAQIADGRVLTIEMDLSSPQLKGRPPADSP